MINLNDKITANFTWRELLTSREAIRLGLTQYQENPPLEVIANIDALVKNILQPLREKSGRITVNSGYRSPQLNDRIGGAETSQHLIGQAADIEGVDISNRALAELIVKLKLPFDQLILEFGTIDEPAWIHVSFGPRNRRQILRAVKIQGRTQYLNVTL